MQTQELNTTGLKCPYPIFKLTAKIPDMNPGDVLEIIGDCPTFESDIKDWCERLNKRLVDVKKEENKIKCRIEF